MKFEKDSLKLAPFDTEERAITRIKKIREQLKNGVAEVETIELLNDLVKANFIYDREIPHYENFEPVDASAWCLLRVFLRLMSGEDVDANELIVRIDDLMSSVSLMHEHEKNLHF